MSSIKKTQTFICILTKTKNINFTFLCLLLTQIIFSQQYDTVVIEEKAIDSNNEIYKIGNVFIYDYEIIINNKKSKLKTNKEITKASNFEFVPLESDSIEVKKIHLIVQPVIDSNRVNENQTQISYLQEPAFSSISTTGIVENNLNVWIHPFRKGFFKSLETAPFPYIKKPLKTGTKWIDQMKIGQAWGNDLWGTWEGSLLLTYSYEITGKKKLETKIGEIECYVVKSTASSEMGTTYLISYFSEKYGFIRMEYELLNTIKINIWLVDFLTRKEFNDTRTFFKTKQYIKQ